LYFLYNLIVISASAILRVLALVNSKLYLFVKGRKETSFILKNSITKDDKVIWMHTASLGEYEQGLPILEELKRQYPTHKIVLTFFSPSGYEVKKDSTIADVICYLPLDTKNNVRSFLKATHPDIAIFIKYEIWPNYLTALKERNTPTFLISALFKENQVYFKWYGAFMRNALSKFSHFFVQNEKSLTLLKSIGFDNITIAGDTRFDRVCEILKRENTLDFMNSFKQDEFCFIAGSTWPEDEKLIIDYINGNTHPIKFVIAPHTIKEKHIQAIKQSISKAVVCYSEIDNSNIEDYEVMIIDTIGLLTKIYSYADIAYVGGGFQTGLHNVLEPATFGLPIIIGPKYDKFKEAVDLVNQGGCFVVYNKEEFNSQLKELFTDTDDRKKKGKITKNFISQNIGATKIVLDYISSRIS